MRMNTLPAAVLIVVVAAGSSLATLAAQKQIQKSTVFDWSTADTKPNDWGAVRQVMRTPTRTLTSSRFTSRRSLPASRRTRRTST